MRRPILSFDGTVLDKRELLKRSDRSVWARILKIEARGCNFEVRVSEAEYNAHNVDDEVSVDARITVGNGSQPEIEAVKIETLKAPAKPKLAGTG